jgi:uncharacterized protein (DUF3820 family)
MIIPFGKHRGRGIDQLPYEYLQWLQDPDYNPNGVVRNNINWSEVARQELQRRKQAKRQEMEEGRILCRAS